MTRWYPQLNGTGTTRVSSGVSIPVLSNPPTRPISPSLTSLQLVRHMLLHLKPALRHAYQTQLISYKNIFRGKLMRVTSSFRFHDNRFRSGLCQNESSSRTALCIFNMPSNCKTEGDTKELCHQTSFWLLLSIQPTCWWKPLKSALPGAAALIQSLLSRIQV